jgi:hypothetical protein
VCRNNRANETRDAYFSISNPSLKKVNTTLRSEVERGNSGHFPILTLPAKEGCFDFEPSLPPKESNIKTTRGQ